MTTNFDDLLAENLKDEVSKKSMMHSKRNLKSPKRLSTFA